MNINEDNKMSFDDLKKWDFFVLLQDLQRRKVFVLYQVGMCEVLSKEKGWKDKAVYSSGKKLKIFTEEELKSPIIKVDVGRFTGIIKEE